MGGFYLGLNTQTNWMQIVTFYGSVFTVSTEDPWNNVMIKAGYCLTLSI